MPNMDWPRLNRLQLGRYAEYYAKMEFASYGLEVYTSEVDDHGVDFVTKIGGVYYEIQVKSLRKSPTMYSLIRKDKMDITDAHRLVCLLLFYPGRLPEMYVIPATAWQKPNALLVDRNYEKEGQTSKPEWGIQFSEKNRVLLEPYKIEQFITNIAGGSQHG